MIIELKTNDYNKLKFIIVDGGVSVEFKTEGYSAYQGLSHYDDDWLKKFIDELEAMAQSGAGEAALIDEMGDHVTFELNSMGHLHVSGSLSYHAGEEIKLTFSFKTDQTALSSLVSDLKRSL